MIKSKYPIVQCDMQFKKHTTGVHKEDENYIIGCDMGVVPDRSTVAIVVNGRVKHIIETDKIYRCTATICLEP